MPNANALDPAFLRLDSYENEPLQGDAQELFEQWQRRLKIGSNDVTGGLDYIYK
jgi:hypothetical protein